MNTKALPWREERFQEIPPLFRRNPHFKQQVNLIPNQRSLQMQYRIAIGIVLFTALLIRLFAAMWWHGLAATEGRLFRFGDSMSYWRLAQCLADGMPYQYGGADGSIFRAPGYPMLLSLVASIQTEETAVWWGRVLGCVLGTLTVALVMQATSRIGNKAAVILAGLAASLYPGAVGMSVTLLSEALFVPLMMLQLLWFNSLFFQAKAKLNTACESESIKRKSLKCLLTGVVAGAAILTRPSWLLFPPLFAATTWFQKPKGRNFMQTIIVGCGIILCMSPWWYRNYWVTDRFVLTTLQVGPSLYDGLHPGASGGSDEGMAFVEDFARQQRLEDEAKNGAVESTFEYRLNQRMHRAAIQWTFDNPADAWKLAWIKLRRTWNIWPAAQEVGSFWVRLAETIGCFGIVVLAAWGGWVSRDRWQEIYIFLLPVPYFTLLHMVFVGSIRYRQPAIVALSVLAGIGAAWILGRIMDYRHIERT